MSGAQVANSVAIIEGQGLSRGASQTATVTKMIAAACMMAASPITLAIAQQSSSTPDTLPPLVVEGARKKTAKKGQPAAPTQDAAATASPQAAPEQQPPAAKGANPYANPEAPYKVEQSASGKLSEPLVDTPRTVTTAPREVIEDKGVRDLRELARSVPGLTIGSAEGGNSYGAFAVRGFKANNDIFFDGVRNPGNLIPDVFAVQQIEIYKGPSGGIAGRSTIGGAVNIIPKQPDLGSSFYEVSTTVGTDSTFRTTIDANQKVTPDFAFRANLMYDQHDIAGRVFADSERWGGLISATARLSDSVKVTLDYYRYRNDATPDWGVPVIDAFDVPLTERGLRRSTWFGEKDLDFFKEKADIATASVSAKLVDGITLTN
jgi:catecholate siderophore receptor